MKVTWKKELPFSSFSVPTFMNESEREPLGIDLKLIKLLKIYHWLHRRAPKKVDEKGIGNRHTAIKMTFKWRHKLKPYHHACSV
jgi:hypothetical protein